jgi:hypothetical protein
MLPIAPCLPLGHSYLIGQGPLHDEATIEMVRRVGARANGADVVTASGSYDPAFNARRVAHEPAALEAMQIAELIGTFFRVSPGQPGGWGYYDQKASFVVAALTCLSNQGILPQDTESMGSSKDPWGAVLYRRIWYYAIDWSAVSDADHYATAHVEPSNYGRAFIGGFAVMTQQDGNWSLFREKGSTGFYRSQTPQGIGVTLEGATQFEKDFSLDNWLRDNATTIYDAEVQAIGAILDIYTAGAATAAADVMISLIKQMKPLLIAGAAGDSRKMLTSLAASALTIVSAAPQELALLKDASPGTFAFLSTVGADINKAWDSANKVFSGAVDSINDIETFAPEMVLQASKLATTAGGSVAARGAALLAGNPIGAIGGTIDRTYIENARAAAGVGGFWFDHGWNLDLTAIKMIDTNVPGYQGKVDDLIRQATSDQIAAAPPFARTFVAHGAVVSIMQAAQQGMLVPDPQLRGITQVITKYESGYIPPELVAATQAHIQSVTESAKAGALADNARRNTPPSATITVPGMSTGTIVAIVAAVATVATVAIWAGIRAFRKRKAA